MKIIDGGVTAAKGFKAASTAAEIKYKGRTDMAMVFSEVPCVAAGTFTTNVVKAAPVRWDQDIVYNHPGARAVICNSGIANACTGEEGFGLLQGNRQGSIRKPWDPGRQRTGSIHRCHRNAASDRPYRKRSKSHGTEACGKPRGRP